MAADVFSPDEVARSRAYHRPLYVAWAADLLLSLAVLLVLASGGPGDRLAHAARGPWWFAAAAYTLLVLAAVDVVRLPLAFWRGLVRERRWGFSTQTWRGWAADHVKGFAVGYVFTAAAMAGLVGAVRWFGTWWPAVAAPVAALVALVVTFVAPVVLEPVFNRFRPLEGGVADALRGLAVRAGVPVRDILVADASRRTRKHNAYVSGLGRTRRVVVYDTLLGEATQEELEVVLAHELGHRAHRDVAKGTVLAMASAAAGALVLWPFDPSVRRIPLLLAVVAVFEVATLPLYNAFSRRLERAADRFALELTGDRGAFASAFRRLATANISDLDPPRLVYAWLFSHPSAPERVAAAR